MHTCSASFMLNNGKKVTYFDKVECRTAIQIVSQDPQAPNNAGREVSVGSLKNSILPRPKSEPNTIQHSAIERTWTTGMSFNSQRSHLPREEFARILKCAQDSPDPESFTRCANLNKRV